MKFLTLACCSFLLASLYSCAPDTCKETVIVKDVSNLLPQGTYVSDLHESGRSWTVEFSGDSAVYTAVSGDTTWRLVFDSMLTPSYDSINVEKLSRCQD